MRKPIITILLIFSCLSLNAQNDIAQIIERIGLKLEWGYAQNLFEHHHYNLSSVEGYRINDNQSSLYFQPNAFAMLELEFKAHKHFTFDLGAGFEGIYEDCSIIPLRVGFSYYNNAYDGDGFFSFAKLALGLQSRESLMHNTVGMIGNIGEGYRLNLSKRVSLDAMLSIRGVIANPRIPNPDGPGYAPEENIRYNRAEFLALCFSLALIL